MMNSIQHYRGFYCIKNIKKGNHGMKIGDLLKKTVDSAAKKVQEVSKAASEAGKEMAERRKQLQAEQEAAREKERQEQLEARRAALKEEEERNREAHIAAYETEREERRRKLEHYQSLAPVCEKGDCVMCRKYLYYSCPEDCECRRKKLVDRAHQYALPRPEYMPYMKWVEDLISQVRSACSPNASISEESSAALHMGPHIHLPVTETGCFDKTWVNCFDEVAIALIENLFPEYITSIRKLGLAGALPEMFWGRFTEENIPLHFLTLAHERKFDITVCSENFFRSLTGQRLYDSGSRNYYDPYTVKGGELHIDFHIENDFYYNPSLYQRTQEEFEYAVIVLESITDPSYFKIMCPKYPYDPENYMPKFLDENGNIKPAGLGGPEKGEWGDTIWNTIEETFPD